MKVAEANEPFASGLKVIITDKGIKNVYVARKAGLSAQVLCDMINGRRIIRICDMIKLADVLGITIDDICKAGLPEDKER